MIKDIKIGKIKDLGYRVKKMIDGEPKNVDLLISPSESLMKLYGYEGILKQTYFNSEKELKEHYPALEKYTTIEYLERFAGKTDVIRETNEKGIITFYCAVDEYGYAVYSERRSKYKGKIIWEYRNGSIESMYDAFRDRGVIFENDIYRDIKMFYQRMLNKQYKKTI